MQSLSSRIWTRVAMSISYDDDHYTTGTSIIEWAALIIAVLKTDQSTCLCGDCKMTVNKCTNLDSYPIPKIEDLNMKLSQGRKFTKLDLRSAFLQVLLHKDSKKFYTINIPRGLYQLKCLSFGVKSAPGIYQCCMDNFFMRELHVASYQDNILITRSSDAEHLDTLHRVLKKLLASGLQVRLDKCKFMARSVTYLGYWIDLEGLHPTEDQIRAIRDAPAPHNVMEQKDFLGLYQFYSWPPIQPVAKGHLLEVGNRSLFTDESCPGPL